MVKLIMTKKRLLITRMVYSALCLALCFLLPFITANNYKLGNMLCLMHIPVFLAGFAAGPFWGAAVGFAAPLLRSIALGAPPMLTAIPMAFELAAYAFISGLLNRILPKKLPYIYVSLASSMLGGRIVWGCVKFFMYGIGSSEFSFALFISSGFIVSLPGVVLHILIVPTLIIALRKAKLISNE